MINYCKDVGLITAPLFAITVADRCVGGMSRHIGRLGAAALCLGAVTLSAFRFYTIADRKITLLQQAEQQTGQSKRFEKIAAVVLLSAGVGVGAVACICVAFPPPSKQLIQPWEWQLPGSTNGMKGPCNGEAIFQKVEEHPNLPPMTGYNYYALPRRVNGTGTAQVISLAREIFEKCSSVPYAKEKNCVRGLLEKYNESNRAMRDLQALINTVRGCVVPGVDYHKAIMGAIVLPQNLEVVGVFPPVGSLACTQANTTQIMRTIADLPDGMYVFRFFCEALEHNPAGAIATRSTLWFSDGSLRSYFDPGNSSAIAGRFHSNLDIAWQLAHGIVGQTARTDGKVMQLRIYSVAPFVPPLVVQSS